MSVRYQDVREYEIKFDRSKSGPGIQSLGLKIAGIPVSTVDSQPLSLTTEVKNQCSDRNYDKSYAQNIGARESYFSELIRTGQTLKFT